MLAANIAIPNYLQQVLPHRALPQTLPGTGQPWLMRLREEALTRFLQTGLPSTREEDWRYTSLHAIEKSNFHISRDIATTEQIPHLAKDATRIVLVNGLVREDMIQHVLPQGLRITSLRDRLQKEDPALRYAFPEAKDKDSWHDLNLALFADGLVIEVAPGTHIEKPVEIIHMRTAHSSPVTQHSRHILHVGEGASLQLIEYQLDQKNGAEASFYTSFRTILVEKGASVRRISVGEGGMAALDLSHDQISVLKDARYEQILLNLPGRIARRKIQMLLEEKGAEAHLHAVTFVAGQSHGDLVTDFRHNAPHTSSVQMVRALAAENARAVFQGKITVAKGADKTDAKQEHRGLLLSPQAEIDAKPGLEIYAEDVSCSHGATCGALDENALFYMQSRGISRKEAEALLRQAFVSSAFDKIEDEELKENLLSVLQARMKSA
jgi:Fe-S cluster assembly protein SufD